VGGNDPELGRINYLHIYIRGGASNILAPELSPKPMAHAVLETDSR
jgi:hypothetical protein